MKISIIIPVLNEEKFIESNLISLMNQTYSFTELIIVDDGSSDHTVDIVKKLISSNSSIRLIEKSEISYNDSGKKIINAFYRGYSKLSKQWDVICKFDSDLIFPENYLEKLVLKFKKNNNIGIFGGILKIQKNNIWAIENVSNDDHVRGPIKAYSKDCYDSINGLKAVDGWDIVDEFLAMYYGFEVFVDKQLYVKHLRPTGAIPVKNNSYKKGSVFYFLGYDFVLALLACLKLSYTQKINFFAVYMGYIVPFVLLKEKYVNQQQSKFIRNHRWTKILKIFTKFNNK